MEVDLSLFVGVESPKNPKNDYSGLLKCAIVDVNLQDLIHKMKICKI